MGSRATYQATNPKSARLEVFFYRARIGDFDPGGPFESLIRKAAPRYWIESQIKLLYLGGLESKSLDEIRHRLARIETSPDSIVASLQLLRSGSPAAKGRAHGLLGKAYHQISRFEENESSLELVIKHYEESLKYRTKEADCVYWSSTLNNLAAAYCTRQQGDEQENIRKSIDLYKLALTVVDVRLDPKKWAMLHQNMGRSFSRFRRGDRQANLYEAIRCFDAACSVRRDHRGIEWINSMQGLAGAYQDLAGEGESNFRAIQIYNETLSVIDKKTELEQWQIAKSNLGSLYAGKFLRDEPSNLETSIRLFREVESSLSRKANPVMWARTMHNLADVSLKLFKKSLDGDLDQILKDIEYALEIRTEKTFPMSWAMSFTTLTSVRIERHQRGFDSTSGLLLRDSLMQIVRAGQMLREKGYDEDCKEAEECIGYVNTHL